MSPEELAEIVHLFEEGTKKYRVILKKISQLRPPAKVMGIHKSFEKAYTSYVAGCEEMTQSIQPESGVDHDLFDASEEKTGSSDRKYFFSHPKNDKFIVEKIKQYKVSLKNRVF